MKAQGSSGKGHKNRKLGRDKAKCEAYRRENLRAKHKVKKVLKSCGRAFAEKWAKERGVKLPVYWYRGEHGKTIAVRSA